MSNDADLIIWRFGMYYWKHTRLTINKLYWCKSCEFSRQGYVRKPISYIIGPASLQRIEDGLKKPTFIESLISCF